MARIEPCLMKLFESDFDIGLVPSINILYTVFRVFGNIFPTTIVTSYTHYVFFSIILFDKYKYISIGGKYKTQKFKIILVDL